MLRKFHSWFGLISTVLVVLLSITGAVLSVNPVIEFAQVKVVATPSISAAELTGKLAPSHPDAEQIQRTPSGSIIVYYTENGQTGADLINPITGETIEAYSNSPVMVWLKKLHRSYLLGSLGRIGAGITAFIILLLTISGAIMVTKRLGGWRQILRPIQGAFRQRLHCQMGRVAVLALMLSATTGLYMSAVTFELLPDYQSLEPVFPESVKGDLPASIDTLTALKSIPISELRELVYPYKNDHNDVYSITTHQGRGFIDQSTGQLLSFKPFNNKQKLYEFIYMLHTGEGLWWLGLLLGLGALAVPLMSWTGIQIWWSRRRSATTINNNTALRSADTVILVGSEGNSTWGFAKTFHNALNLVGYRAHTMSMNNFANNSVSCYSNIKQLFILTATYGDGGAPASASHFLTQLDKMTEIPEFLVAVLGFGDRQFPGFCQYAKDVQTALTAKGCSQLLPLDTINRQSPQEFSRWGNTVGRMINTELSLLHTPNYPSCTTLSLVERVDYGAEVKAPTAVLRFKQSAVNKALPHFEAGDLVGILAPGSKVARFYSLASASKDGMLEICIRLHSGGLCSSFLHSLSVGDSIEAFIQLNPSFRPASGKAPIVLIGAGTGIGPLVGFIRNNKSHHRIHLYWGGRSRQSDFLYESELNSYLKDRRLTELNTVFSRSNNRSYVQEKIAVDSLEIRGLIAKGAQILVCGGRDMASSVMVALDEVIAPMGIDVLTLKAQGRYREDVY